MNLMFFLLERDASMEDDNGDDGYENEDEEGECTELRFVPEDKSILSPLFLAMNDCQALHPDDQSDSEKEASEGEEEEGEEDENEEYINVPDLQIIGQPIFRRNPPGNIILLFFKLTFLHFISLLTQAKPIMNMRL